MRPAPGTHIRYNFATNHPASFRGWWFELWRTLCRFALFAGRFRTAGDWPDLKQAVLVAAPHTSNWDAIWMLAAAGHYRVRLRWMGKKSLTEGPFGWAARLAGCVPVDRQRAGDLVTAMAQAFEETPDLLLAVAPEGTRDPVAEWKSGFWHIARAAKVPLLFTVMDYGTRTVYISGHYWPTDDYAADLAVIRSHYADARPRHHSRFSIESAKPKA